MNSILVSPGWDTPEMRRQFSDMDQLYRRSWGMNVLLPDDLQVGARFTSGGDHEKYPWRIESPSVTMLLMDSVNAINVPHFGNTGNMELAASRYDGQLSTLFCDGHAVMIRLGDERLENISGTERRLFWVGSTD
jgi:prepilin-type processing-associated H-X9-DG protein